MSSRNGLRTRTAKGLFLRASARRRTKMSASCCCLGQGRLGASPVRSHSFRKVTCWRRRHRGSKRVPTASHSWRPS
eukprot:5889971-Pyramimonas_sp.AAC.1